MVSLVKHGLLCFINILLCLKICTTNFLPQSYLALFSPGLVEYTDVIVRMVGENLTLTCERRGPRAPAVYVWNYVARNGSGVSNDYKISPTGLSLSSNLTKLNLQLSDSGLYYCTAPPHSIKKYVLVQPRSEKSCPLGSFRCGAVCVLPYYVCDGRRDCLAGEDEAPDMCMTDAPCAGADKLNCSSGRCVSELLCCRPGTTICQQPYCCDEHPRHSRVDGMLQDLEYPALLDDRQAPDEYGFIQSTIYTVTACALIFMIAVVLLVSAICKMHMKRAALRTMAARRNNHHSNMFGSGLPPCYEASRLLEEQRRMSPQHRSPQRSQQPQTTDLVQDQTEESPSATPPSPPTGLSRLGAMFTGRYRQVPTECTEVEMQNVRCASLNNSPSRTRPAIDNYRSPTFCDYNTTDYYLAPQSESGPDLNFMTADCLRQHRGAIDRIIDQIGTRRPLTLQLGRFQLNIPRFGRNSSNDNDRRPDTPNIAEINIDDLNFVRLNDTYTLNGRTIRLLGADFENYPNVMTSNDIVRPPPYTDAMRYKLYGPPPEYLSRDTLNNGNSITTVDEEARNNVEMPPRYEDLASGLDRNRNHGSTATLSNEADFAASLSSVVITETNITDNVTVLDNDLANVIDNLPAIDSDVNANGLVTNSNNVPENNGNVPAANE